MFTVVTVARLKAAAPVIVSPYVSGSHVKLQPPSAPVAAIAARYNAIQRTVSGILWALHCCEHANSVNVKMFR